MSLLLWQQEYLISISQLSNRALLEEALDLAGGDDWDGCFTKRGSWKYTQLREELERRLVAWLGPKGKK